MRPRFHGQDAEDERDLVDAECGDEEERGGERTDDAPDGAEGVHVPGRFPESLFRGEFGGVRTHVSEEVRRRPEQERYRGEGREPAREREAGESADEGVAEEDEDGDVGGGEEEHPRHPTVRRPLRGALPGTVVPPAQCGEEHADDAPPRVDATPELGRDHPSSEDLQPHAGDAGDDDRQLRSRHAERVERAARAHARTVDPLGVNCSTLVTGSAMVRGDGDRSNAERSGDGRGAFDEDERVAFAIVVGDVAVDGFDDAAVDLAGGPAFVG